MEIRSFKIPYHYMALIEMLRQRKAHEPSIDQIPAVGCMVFDDETPVAAAFLLRVEGGYGMVDGLTSNPTCSSEQRHKALDMAIQYCIEEAAMRGITSLISFCADKTTVSRAESNGFVKQPHYIVTLDLKAKI